jgi:hypothetical protein
MSNYTKSTNFATKDSLSSGNPLKIVKGTEIDTEFNNIQTAVATKADLISPTLVTPNLGTPTSIVLTSATGLPLSTGISGTLPVANGGTGGTTAAVARSNLLPTYATNAGKVLAVNAGSTDVEYISAGGTGTVTSVSGAGSVNGITLTGTVTSAGSLTLGGTLASVNLGTQTTGTLAISRGGTGQTTLAAAGIITTTGGQTIAGAFTATGAVTLGDSAVSQTLTFNNQSNFIASGGGGGFGRTSPNANYALFVQSRATTGTGGLVTQDGSGDIGYLAFTSATGTELITLNYGTLSSAVQVGSITTNGTTTTYGTSSDYRLKENIAPLTNAVTRIKQLSPKTFTWKGNASLGTAEGFIAHELQAVLPEAVHGEKDGLDKYDKPKYQSVDASFIIPMLTSALQEALTRIESLEAKVG